jgi:hypothetical protein
MIEAFDRQLPASIDPNAMPVEVSCTACQGRFRVPDTAAGKRIKCPKCKSPIDVPAAEPVEAEAWTLKTEEGQEYGPVSRAELDQWFEEGRITADSQVLLTGAPQWQWATDLYPALSQPTASTIAASSGSDSAVFDPGGSTVRQGGSSVARRGSSVSRHSSVGTRTSARGKGSPAVQYLAIATYIIGSIQALFGILFMVFGAGLAALFTGAAASSGDAEAAQAAGAIGGIMTAFFVGIGIFIIVLSIPTFVAAYGLMQRKQWGRILTLILAALTGLSGVASFPAGIISIGYAVWAFIVLLDKKYAAEFS